MSSGQKSDSPARACLLSPRLIKQTVCRCSAYEFEDAVVSFDGADLLRPRYRPLPNGLRRNLERITRHTPFGVWKKPTVEPARVDRDYELFFFLAQSVADLELLDAVEDVATRCRKRVCWIEEIWTSGFTNPNERKFTRQMLRRLQGFDAIFLNCLGSVELVHQATGAPCHYIPPGIDALRFCPPTPWPPRVIDVYYMGRRSDVTHRALLHWAKSNGRFYMYDTGGLTNVTDAAQHRTYLAGLIQRTRYFFANRSKVNAGEQTQGQEEFGFRFFEGMAGGAVLVGDAPRNGAFSTCFDWPNAVFHVPFDCEDVGDIIDDLERQPELLERTRQLNVANILRRHDWVHRWRSVLETVGLQPSVGMQARDERLQSLAAKVELQLGSVVPLGA